MIDLARFCSKDPQHIYLHQPWSRDGFTWASNGHFLVRIPKLDKIGDNPRAPNCNKLFTRIADQLSLSPLPSIPALPESKEDCDACDGRGTEHGCPNCACECTECGGSGEKLTQTSITINNAIYNAAYIAEICRLPGVRFSNAPPISSPARFVFDGGEGAIMPRTVRCSAHLGDFTTHSADGPPDRGGEGKSAMDPPSPPRAR
jgi:hypothetical protein